MQNGEKKKGKEEAERFAGILLSNISVLLFLMTILSYFIAPYIIDILAPGFNEETKNLTLNFTYIMLPGIIFWGTYGIIAGIYNSQKSFVIPNIAGVLGNAVFILCIFLFHNKIGAYILPWGYLANVIFQYFLLLPGLRRIHFKLRGEVNFRYEGMKKALYLIGPILLGQSMGILNMAVDRIFGSFLPEGSISALNYASRIYHLPINLFVNAVATAIYTEFAFNAQSNNMDSLKSSMEKSLRAVLFFVIPSTFGFTLLANPIVRLAFQRGAFDALATQRTAECLIFYSIGLTFMSINPIMVRAFYALHDTKTPTINSMIALLSNIVLNFLFIRPLAHKGLALATSIASIISTILLYRSLKKKIPEPFSKDMMKNILRFVFGGILIGVLALISFNLLSVYLSKGQITFAISLLFSVGIAALFYLYLGNRWKIEEAKRIFNIIKKNLEVITHFLSLK